MPVYTHGIKLMNTKFLILRNVMKKSDSPLPGEGEFLIVNISRHGLVTARTIEVHNHRTLFWG